MNSLKLKKFISIVAYFFSFQILIQGIDAFSGILIIRNLSKVDYAYFGIASSFATSVINISIGGVGSYLMLEGIKIKNQVLIYSEMFAEIQRFVTKNKYFVISVSVPIVIWIYLKNDLPSIRLCLFLPLIIADVLLRVKIQLYQSTYNIWEKYNKIQFFTLIGSISRIVLVVSFSFFFTAEVAYLGLVFSYAVQLYLLTKQIDKYMIVVQTKSTKRFPDLRKLYRSQLPINLYNFIDSQFVVFILTFFGNTILLADVNAAGRLSLFVVAINAFINNYIVVQFAKVENKQKFINLLFLTIIVFIFFYVIAILASYYWPEVFIWIIGKQYSNVMPFIYLTVTSICIANFSGLIYAVNYSKMWITKSWISIPFTIILQILMLAFMPPANFEQVWYYAIICAVPTLLLNIWFCIKGIGRIQIVQT